MSGNSETVTGVRRRRLGRHRAPGARLVTSVCTGALIPAAAGLLDGYRAATHWATFAIFEALGVEGVRERVVVDRNRISGSGVTAGIDFGLQVLAELRGDVVARTVRGMLRQDMEERGVAAARAVTRRRLATAGA